MIIRAAQDGCHSTMRAYTIHFYRYHFQRYRITRFLSISINRSFKKPNHSGSVNLVYKWQVSHWSKYDDKVRTLISEKMLAVIGRHSHGRCPHRCIYVPPFQEFRSPQAQKIAPFTHQILLLSELFAVSCNLRCFIRPSIHLLNILAAMSS